MRKQSGFDAELLARGSSEVVYVLGVSGGRVELLRSTDDGLGFSLVSLPPVSHPTPQSPLGDIESLGFGSASDGFVELSGNSVYATEDGGSSWQRARPPATGLLGRKGSRCSARAR